MHLSLSHTARALSLAACIPFALPSSAQGPLLRPAAVLGDGMVLQRGEPVRVWGHAAAGAVVSVAFAGQEVGARADGEGRWSATLAALEASAEGRPLALRSGGEEVVVEDVLVGEVWLTSGQSNMVWGLSGDSAWELESKSADSPLVRYCRIEPHASGERLEDLRRRPRWVPLVASEGGLRGVSAVSYYFGVRLSRYLDVPVGIVCNAWGGTTAEAWTARATLEELPELQGLLAHWDGRLADWENEKARRIAAHEEQVRKAEAAGEAPPRGPNLNPPHTDRNLPGGCFHALAWPIRQLSLGGVLFYQGENNAVGQWDTYRVSFPAVIADHREAFGRPDLPFGIISLAGLGPSARDRTPEEEEVPGVFYFAAIRDTHLRTHEATPDTGLIVTFDLGDADNIHPHRKRAVAERSARWALSQVYGEPVAHRGPHFRSMERAGGRLRLSFDLDPTADPDGPWYVSLPITRAGAYRGFTVAGEDRHFHPAEVRRLDKEHVLEVWSDLVPAPVAVRYGWAANPDGNLIGLHHLPAPPFRSDDWELIPQPPYDAEGERAWKEQRDERLREARELARQRRLEEAQREVELLGGAHDR